MKIPKLKVKVMESYSLWSWSDYKVLTPDGIVDPKSTVNGIFRDGSISGDFIGAQREPSE